MSIKSAIIGSAVGFSISSITCYSILELIKRSNKHKVNNEGETLSITRRLTPVFFEQFSNVVIVTSGLIGLLYGMRKEIKLLKN
tara:strand:+ start:636 stop:887 length:252 start_codon:yes stop_codon:yes gene_type:complete